LFLNACSERMTEAESELASATPCPSSDAPTSGDNSAAGGICCGSANCYGDGATCYDNAHCWRFRSKCYGSAKCSGGIDSNFAVNECHENATCTGLGAKCYDSATCGQICNATTCTSTEGYDPSTGGFVRAECNGDSICHGDNAICHDRSKCDGCNARCDSGATCIPRQSCPSCCDQYNRMCFNCSNPACTFTCY